MIEATLVPVLLYFQLYSFPLKPHSSSVMYDKDASGSAGTQLEKYKHCVDASVLGCMRVCYLCL